MDRRTDLVRRFYERTPFPGYPPRDTLATFRARAGHNAFVRLLDHAIAGDARIVDVGCGTGQMSLYLARGDRLVVGVDLTRASLALGRAAAQRFDLRRVHFVETDLRDAGLRPGTFDVVVSTGVLHHTPDPRQAFAAVAALARPGGVIVLGVYNAFARIPLRVRRTIARACKFRVVPGDPVLRDRRTEPARRDAWLRDQYLHPEEHRHTLREVQHWFAENGVKYLRTYPSTVWDDNDPPDLFAPAADDWIAEGWLAQVQWMWTLGREGGLFFTLGRRTA
jgi:2-polyprenyl-3-methyl-5-hydroxy-6-metoxy-1,4-benzoquinol methylase